MEIKRTYTINAHDSITCEYFCIRVIDFMLKGKSFLDYINLFSPDKFEKNYKTILKCFQ